MKHRVLLALVCLLIGVALGASATFAGGKARYKSCFVDDTGTCATLSNWCFMLKFQAHPKNIEDPEVRAIMLYWRSMCRRWR